MKQFTSAILLLVASTLAAAIEPVSGTNQSLVMAYNDSSVNSMPTEIEVQKTVSKQDAKRVLEKTLDVVSANLTVELDMPFDAMFVAQ